MLPQLLFSKCNGCKGIVCNQYIKVKLLVDIPDVCKELFRAQNEVVADVEVDLLHVVLDALPLGKYFINVVYCYLFGVLEEIAGYTQLSYFGGIGRTGIPAYVVASRLQVDGQGGQGVKVSVGGDVGEEDLLSVASGFEAGRQLL